MRRRIALAAAAVCATAVTTGVAVQQATGEQAAPPPPKVLIANASDRLPSQSASDWVTYADHVVAVTAIAEQEVPPSATEIERGEGLIGREVTLSIDRVLWSREGAAKPAPSTWKRSSMGWQFTGGDPADRVKMARDDGPRVEKGHSYITAIVWEQDRCLPEGGDWRGLGEGSTVPYDNATIGEGELEGRMQTAEQAAKVKAAGGPNIGLEDEMAGKNADALVQALKTAEPGKRTDTNRPSDGTCD